MPTFDKLARFLREYQALTPAERTAFLQAVADFVEDLRRGNFRASLHVHALPGFPGIFSMAWSGDGRATFRYGEQVREGEPHIVWRRVGGHGIYREP